MSEQNELGNVLVGNVMSSAHIESMAAAYEGVLSEIMDEQLSTTEIQMTLYASPEAVEAYANYKAVSQNENTTPEAKRDAAINLFQTMRHDLGSEPLPNHLMGFFHD